MPWVADEQRVMADLRQHGELVLTDHGGLPIWTVVDRGDGKGRHFVGHRPSVVERLAGRGELVIVRGTRAVLPPRKTT